MPGWLGTSNVTCAQTPDAGNRQPKARNTTDANSGSRTFCLPHAERSEARHCSGPSLLQRIRVPQRPDGGPKGPCLFKRSALRASRAARPAAAPSCRARIRRGFSCARCSEKRPKRVKQARSMKAPGKILRDGTEPRVAAVSVFRVGRAAARFRQGKPRREECTKRNRACHAQSASVCADSFFSLLNSSGYIVARCKRHVLEKAQYPLALNSRARRRWKGAARPGSCSNVVRRAGREKHVHFSCACLAQSRNGCR